MPERNRPLIPVANEDCPRAKRDARQGPFPRLCRASTDPDSLPAPRTHLRRYVTIPTVRREPSRARSRGAPPHATPGMRRLYFFPGHSSLPQLHCGLFGPLRWVPEAAQHRFQHRDTWNHLLTFRAVVAALVAAWSGNRHASVPVHSSGAGRWATTRVAATGRWNLEVVSASRMQGSKPHCGAAPNEVGRTTKRCSRERRIRLLNHSIYGGCNAMGGWPG